MNRQQELSLFERTSLQKLLFQRQILYHRIMQCPYLNQLQAHLRQLLRVSEDYVVSKGVILSHQPDLPVFVLQQIVDPMIVVVGPMDFRVQG